MTATRVYIWEKPLHGRYMTVTYVPQEAGKAELDPKLAAAGAEAQAAQAVTPLDSMVTVLGSSTGATLRKVTAM